MQEKKKQEKRAAAGMVDPMEVVPDNEMPELVDIEIMAVSRKSWPYSSLGY